MRRLRVVIRNRLVWLAFTTAMGGALAITAAATLLRVPGDTRLINTAITFGIGAFACGFGALVVARDAQGGDDPVAYRRGFFAAAVALLGLATIPDLGDFGEFGALQYTVLAMAGAVALLTVFGSAAFPGSWIAGKLTMLAASDPLRPRPAASLTRGEGIAALIAFAAAGFVFFWLASDGPLGHDESVYAVKARSWIDGTPSTGFAAYRPIGMAAAAWGVLMAGGAELELRLLGAAVALVTVIVVWRLGRSLLSPATGLLAAILLSAAPSFLRRAPEFLNDIATTGLILAILLLLWRHFEGFTRSRWEVVAVAPLAAIGFYLRYGVVSSYLIILIVGAVIWRKQLRTSLFPLSVTAALLAFLVLPHIAFALTETGSPIGVLTSASDAAGREYLGEGLLTYLRWWPSKLAGRLVGGTMAIGVAAVVVSLAMRWMGDTARRAQVVLGTVGIGQLILAGVFVHAEQRYVFSSIALLTLVGAYVVVEAWGMLKRPLRCASTVVAVVVFAAGAVPNVRDAHEKFDDLATDRMVVAVAGEVIAAAAPEEDCVVMTSYIPQITWYSGCATTAFGRSQPPGSLVDGTSRIDFVLFFEEGKRQPTGPVLEQYLEEVPMSLLDSVDSATETIGDAQIYVLEGARE